LEEKGGAASFDAYPYYRVPCCVALLVQTFPSSCSGVRGALLQLQHRQIHKTSLLVPRFSAAAVPRARDKGERCDSAVSLQRRFKRCTSHLHAFL